MDFSYGPFELLEVRKDKRQKTKDKRPNVIFLLERAGWERIGGIVGTSAERRTHHVVPEVYT